MELRGFFTKSSKCIGLSGNLMKSSSKVRLNNIFNNFPCSGLSGTLEGQQGRPGVVYDNKKKEIRVNVRSFNYLLRGLISFESERH